MEKNKYEIKYLQMYTEDLLRILNYITYDLQNPIAAENILRKINKAISRRSFNPLSYEVFNRDKKSKKTWYKIRADKYVIFYYIIENTMYIARILYSKRDFYKHIN